MDTWAGGPAWNAGSGGFAPSGGFAAPGGYADPGVLLGGAGAPGPPPDAVAEAGRRLWALARELEDVRAALNALVTVDWESTAAAAYRSALADCSRALAETAGEFDGAAAAVTRHAEQLRYAASHCVAPPAGVK